MGTLELDQTDLMTEKGNQDQEQPPHTRWTISRLLKFIVTAGILSLNLLHIIRTEHSLNGSNPNLDLLKSREEAAWSRLAKHTSLLSVPPIAKSEFLTRQSALSQALSDSGFDAFIAEPSANSAYFANVSAGYELSERPFLLVFQASGQFSYLAPTFELDRIASLEMVGENITVIPWSEEQNPYAVLASSLNLTHVAVDKAARFMIVAGLESANVTVSPPTRAIDLLRSVKSPHEVEILTAINHFTIHLIRAVQWYMKPGMTQSHIASIIDRFYRRAGVPESWSIVLFGADAANPHGGSLRTTGLAKDEFVLIDTGSTLHGYGSDVTRTILSDKSHVSHEWMQYWHLVHDAQSAAINASRIASICANVDRAARQVIASQGMDQFFTHRLGHGLGMEMHEEPYLNGANSDALVLGNVVTNEPGIYVTKQQAEDAGMKTGFGIRIEDAVVVTAQGGQLLTPARAKSPWEP